MITIYNSNTTDFNNNGIAVLNSCIKVEVTEELNGDYSLDLEYPIFGNIKWQYLINDNIIKCLTPKGTQLFRIAKVIKNMSSVDVYARHIFYDLIDNFIEDVSITGMNGAEAINAILTGTQYTHNFKGYSDLENVGTASYLRKNPVESILDGDNSFLDTWGGELLRDDFDIHINASIGEDRGYTILYGKNLQSVEDNSDYTNIVTRVMPVGRDESGNEIELPEKYVDSPLINNYIHPHVKNYDFPDIKVNAAPSDGSAIVTLNNVYTQLREQANLLFSKNHIDIPVIAYTIDFVELCKTEEYKDYSILQQIYIGDTVAIKHQRIGINLKAKLIKYVYDGVLEKYISMELGDVTSVNAGVVNITINSQINGIQLNIDDVKFITDKLKNALGGYCIKRDNEMLIMDTPNIATATKVWRWNLNGLGYSSTGYNGTYGVAITMDGEIVANFIKTGELDADLIRVGTITSSDGSFSISLDNGHMTTYDKGTNKALDFYKESISFFDYLGTGTPVGDISSTRQQASNGTYTAQPAIKVAAKVGSSVLLSARSTDSTYDTTILEVSNNTYGDGIRTNIHQPFFVDVTNRSALYLQGSGNNMYGNLEHQGYSLTGIGNLSCVNLNVSGGKSCKQTTKSFGDKLFYAYEFGEHYLGDIVFGKISNGLAVVYGNGLIQECLNMDIDYHVKFYPYESCNYKIEKHQGYINITADKDIEFDLEIMAKRRDFENIRLEDADSVKSTLNQPNEIIPLNDTLKNDINNDLSNILLNGLNLNTKLLEVE